jgi:hypothetical protein
LHRLRGSTTSPGPGRLKHAPAPGPGKIIRIAIDDLLVVWIIADEHLVQLSLSSCAVGVAKESHFMTNGNFQRLLELFLGVSTSRDDFTLFTLNIVLVRIICS